MADDLPARSEAVLCVAGTDRDSPAQGTAGITQCYPRVQLIVHNVSPGYS